MQLITASLPQHYEAAEELIKAYILFLGEDLGFQNLEDEFKNLPVMYGPPNGSLILCRTDDGKFAGMVANRNKGKNICEMKRLFVLPQYNGLGIGKTLCLRIIEMAKSSGYRFMVLDTLERLTPAIQLYQNLGFKTVAAYYDNPLSGVVYMKKEL